MSGVVSFGVGELFSSSLKTGVTIAKSLKASIGEVGLSIVQAGTHAISQGVLSVMQGGSFEQAFWSGALGSLGASGWNKMFGTNGASMIAFGALSGGIGAELSGGNFWEGAVIGGIVAGLNHAMHKMGEDPKKKNYKKRITFKQARKNYLEGKGNKLYQDIQAMGVTLYESDFNTDGIAVINYDQKGFNGVDNALVHGNVTFERVPGNPEYAQVKYVKSYKCRCGMYDFEMHGTPLSSRSDPRQMIRNAATAIGSLVNSTYNNGLLISGKPFLIQYTNVVKILK